MMRFIQDKRLRTVLLLAIVATSLYFGKCIYDYNNPISLPVNDSGELTSLQMADDMYINKAYGSWKKGSVASIVEYENEHLLMVDYGILTVLDYETGEMMDVSFAEKDKYGWIPTGINYNKNTGLCYIANYGAHNVLVGNIEEAENGPCFHVILELKTEGMISPENVATNSDGTRIAVADYDGNALFLFDNNGVLLWKRNVGLAHGVAMDDKYVYVTSLQDRTITKYDLKGNQLVSKGKLGAIGTDAYMWPTSLYIYKNQILLADAHAGRVFTLDKDLNYISSIGGNSPSPDAFNFPYCVTVAAGKIYVGDTYNKRILKIDFGGRVLGQLGWGNIDKLNALPWGHIVFPYDKQPYTYGRMTDISAGFFNPNLNDSLLVVNAFGGIDLFSDDGGIFRKVLITKQAITDFEYYMVFSKHYQYKGKEYALFFSPQGNGNIIIYSFTDNLMWPSMIAGMDSVWEIDDIWYGFDDDVKAALERSLNGVEGYVDKYNYLKSVGYSPKLAYIETFLDYYKENCEMALFAAGRFSSKERFSKWLEGFFVTDAGKYYLREYDDSYTNRNMDIAVKKYYDDIFNQKQQMYLTEILFMKTFAE